MRISRRILRTVIVAFAIPAIAVSAVTADDAGEPLAPTLEGLGDLHYAITTSSVAAQRFFDQGLRLVYAFNHAEAIRAFEEASRLDPEAPMPHWGKALALGRNLNDSMPRERELQALESLKQAQGRSDNASKREQALIDALASRYSTDDDADRATMDAAWVEAIGKVAERFPDDPEPATLHAAAIMNTMPWDYWRGGKPQPGTLVAKELLERVIAAHPDHPGAHHYYIHLMEAREPQLAEPSADALGKLMPAAGHLVHMPAHIYIRVGRYDDAVTSNQRAIAADVDYIAQCNAQGLYAVGYYPHNIHFLWASATFGGRAELAIETADHLADEVPVELAPALPFLQNYLATPLFARVRFGRWQEVLDTPRPPAGQTFQTAMWHYAQGLALAAGGDPRGARRHLKALGKLRRSTELAELSISFATGSDLVRLTEHLLAGEIQATRGRMGRAIDEMRSAVTLQDSFRYAEPPSFHYPVRQSLGAVLLEAGRASEAEAVYRRDLEHNPHNGWSLFGLAQALRAQERNQEANEVHKRFVEAWQSADVEPEASVFR
ncbi:MAG: tetratricopeptide repeat protein [Acidobacteriota bacterium]|nr:tetratricopeptide repeat protein [Acidobacteriota bacterium]